MDDTAAFPSARPVPQGILLAAGLGSRFDPSGRQDKLLQTLADGRPLLWHSAHHLASALPAPLAVIRPGQDVRRRVLEAAGCRVLEAASACAGMGAALAAAVQASTEASGWVVALGDMPWIPPDLIRRIAAAIDAPDAIAAPFHAAQRGHPVAFGPAWLQTLCGLQGDSGARDLLRRHTLVRIDCTSPSILRDVDLPDDLAAPT